MSAPKKPMIPRRKFGDEVPSVTDADRSRQALDNHSDTQAGNRASAAATVTETRRSRLSELREERQQAHDPEPAGTAGAIGTPVPDTPMTVDEVQQRELLEFLRGMVERDRKRRYQLELIKGFLDDPVAFGLQTDVVPTSSTQAEIARRKKDLEYRVRLLESMLEIYKGELELLGMAETEHKAGSC